MQEKNIDYYYGTQTMQISFYKLPRALFKDDYFKDISSDAKLLYALMLDRTSISMKNGWLDVKNRVYIIYKLEDIMEELGCSKPTSIKIVRELDSAGLIEKVHSGGGKPDIIYVKNLSSSGDEQKEEPEKKVKPEIKINNVVLEQQIDISKTTKNFDLKGKDNSPKKVKEIDLKGQNCLPQGVKEFDHNYINNNYINTSYINPIYQSQDQDIAYNQTFDMIDKIDTLDSAAYRVLIRKNLEYDSFVTYADKDSPDTELYREIYELICDIVCINKQTVRINKQDYPYQVVKSQFLKLTNEHVEYVIERMKTNTADIRNIRAYLITALYNAPSTMSNYYQQLVQHDMYAM